MVDREFRRGFVIAERAHRFADTSAFSRWNRILVPGHKLWVHPDADVRRVEDLAGRIVLAIGDVFVAHGREDLDSLLLGLANGRVEVTDLLSGRFLLMVVEGEDATIYHDPLGSQSIFYVRGERTVVASHATLLAESQGYGLSARITKYMRCEEYRARRTQFLPGDLTRYDEIVHLVPNNRLAMRSGSTMRYWPRRPCPSSTAEDLHELWDEYFSAFVRYLGGRYRAVIGLTGGQDSRTVLATTEAHGLPARYVTWDRMPEAEAERIPAIAQHIGRRHTWLRMGEKPELNDLDAVRKAAASAAGHTRGLPLLPAQMLVGSTPRDVFLKGLGGEVMRGPFNTRAKPYLPHDQVELGYALYAGNVRHGAAEAYATFTRGAIEGFLKRANYGGDLFGADVGDLIYWEQRMGTWTSVQHAELSVAMHSMSAMNDRLLFESAWGLPDSDRFSDELLLGIMRRYDPQLAEL